MIAFLFFGCSDVQTKEQPKELTHIMSTSFPSQYLVKRLLPDVPSHCILPKDADSMHWNPKPEQVASLAQSDLIVSVGAGFEGWMATASLPSQKVLSLSKGVEMLPLTGQTHSHGKSGAHEHKGVDPHVWLDPLLYGAQANNLRTGLSRFPLLDRTVINSRYSVLEEELQELSVSLSQQKDRLGAYRIAADSHQFVYLAQALHLPFQIFDFPEDSELLTKHKQDFLEWYIPKQPTLIVWSRIPSDVTRAHFPKEVEHLYVDPLVAPTENDLYDYVDQYKQNLKRMESL
jgi:zinc transport system substrate-binding protein